MMIIFLSLALVKVLLLKKRSKLGLQKHWKFFPEMIIKKHIAETLDYLDRKYNASLLSPDPHESIYYSKLAILEYCGLD